MIVNEFCFYTCCWAGLTIAKTYAVTGFSGTTPTYGFVSSAHLTCAPSIGARFGGFDIGVRYEGLNSIGFMG
ncbi:hypothetical protein FA048_02530 [Pedobacter polaris]|uniref:Uncharacterized protein n=1 Tax=Pedobacter polaris TaxID=2571273 RepID=A0A4U1CUP9_9SPHI|nr:hypothetical protein [Pedobacter polaris]TKC12513.1 hypothetical protein FA048_02530 [Pedobacter polaris]